MALVPLPDWWESYLALAGGAQPIRDASGQLVVFDPMDETGLNPVQNAYIANNFQLPAASLAAVANNPQGNTVVNSFPTSPVNVITMVIPGGGDTGAALAQLQEYRYAVYGLPPNKLGEVRTSSSVLVGERTGVRPGVLPRIVLPEWARRERGSPL